MSTGFGWSFLNNSYITTPPKSYKIAIITTPVTFGFDFAAN